jgi:hypothetical protein
MTGSRDPAVPGNPEDLPAHRSPQLALLAALVALQGAGLLVIAGFYTAGLVSDAAADQAGTAYAAAMSVFLGLGVLWAARGLLRRRPWARSPVLVVQVLMALVGAGPSGLLYGGMWYVGLGVLVWAVVVAVLLFAPGAAPAER